ncbi:28S ribosomal protein S18b, mitochondrial-like isoform X2 [Mercenaria mercenaria]|nr:28S ribosomal protein S18b, mitochondrial-like isoform X2 [Mercenaria mercenaria]
MVRQISCTVCKFEESDSDERKGPKKTSDPKMEGCKGYIPRFVDPEESLRYMDSEAYKDVYKDEPVWKPYRKNAKGNFYPKIRKTCIRQGAISTASPCPICRDDYLVLDYRNIKLLKQFISEITGKPRNLRQIGLCMRQFKKLQLELAKAQDYGYIEKSFPFRNYDYTYYYNLVSKNKMSESPEDTSQNTNIPAGEPSQNTTEQQSSP